MVKKLAPIVLVTLIVAIAVTSYFTYFNLSAPENITLQNDYLKSVQHDRLTGTSKTRSSSSPHAGVESKRARADYYEKLYRDPKTGLIPNGAGILDIATAEKIDAQTTIKKSAFNLDWQDAGPNNVGGRTRAIGVDVNDKNIFIAGSVAGGIWKSFDAGRNWTQVTPTTFLSSVTSLVQDTRDGFTNNWYAVGGEHDGSSSPFRSENGTHYATGLLHSTDNGNTWDFIPVNGSNFSWNGTFGTTSRIISHPQTGDLFVATNGRGTYITDNPRATWSRTLEEQFAPRFSDINVNRNGVMVQYLSGNSAGVNDYNPGFYASWDNGLTWSPFSIVGFSPDNMRRAVIEFSYSNPNVGYVLIQDDSGTLDNGVDEILLYKLTLIPDEQRIVGQNFTTRLPDAIGRGSGDDVDRLAFNVQGNYNLTLGIHPANEATIFVGLTNLYRIRDVNASTNVNGENAIIDVIIGGYGVNTFFYTDASGERDQHPDHHLMIFPDPENRPNFAISANDGGLYSTEDVLKQGLVEWDNLNIGYNVTQFYHISISPRDGQNQFIAGAQDNGTPFVLVDHPQVGGASLADVSSGDGSFSHIGREYMYTSSQNGNLNRYRVSQNVRDNGINFSGFSYVREFDGNLANSENLPGDGGREFIHPFAVDRVTHGTLYYPAGAIAPFDGFQIFRNSQIRNSINAARGAWEPIPNFSSGSTPTALTTTVEPAGRLIVGTSQFNSSTRTYENGLRIINDASSESPNVLTRNLRDLISGERFEGNIQNIAVNPENASEFIVVFSNYNVKSLAYTTNNGFTFTNIEGNLAGAEAVGDDLLGLSIRAANILPFQGKKLYLIGTSAGLYSTTEINGAETVWTKESENLIGSVPVSWIESRPSDGFIAVATHARGSFWAKANVGTSLDENAANLPLEVSLKQNYPNPFNPQTTIGFDISQSSRVLLDVYNSNGQLVQSLLNSRLNSGSHTYQFNAASLNSGVYFARLQVGAQVITRKMTLMK
jgi:hypothetical protein